MPRAPFGRLVAGIAVCLASCYAPTVSRDRGYHPSDADLTVTRIVNASVILDFRGTRVLVDPWYSSNPPFGQREPIGIALDKLPTMRGILITHRHSDHFDTGALADYPDKQVRVVARRGLGARLRAIGYEDVVEVGDWDRATIGDISLTAVPAEHSVPESGFVLQAKGVTVYVAGDTRFDPRLFWSIVAAFPSMDAALLPVGGIRILGFLMDMTPDQAARAALILKPAYVIPYHYGLTGPFPMVIARTDAPKEFAKDLERRSPGAAASVVILEPGESWHHYH